MINQKNIEDLIAIQKMNLLMNLQKKKILLNKMKIS